MTACPDRRRIAAMGDRLLAEGSAEREEFLAHIRDCPSCWADAIWVDPTLSIDRLSAPDVTVSDIDAVKQQVQSIKRLRGVEGVRRRTSAAQVAVVLLLAALFFLPGPARERFSDTSTSSAFPESSLFDEQNRLSESSLPVVESVTPSAARIYQLGQEDLAVVMIVDESLDL